MSTANMNSKQLRAQRSRVEERLSERMDVQKKLKVTIRLREPHQEPRAPRKSSLRQMTRGDVPGTQFAQVRRIRRAPRLFGNRAAWMKSAA